MLHVIIASRLNIYSIAAVDRRALLNFQFSSDRFDIKWAIMVFCVAHLPLFIK